MTGPRIDRWATCDECRDAGLSHVPRAELETDPIGTWRRERRSGGIAVRWHDHPCDAQYDPDSPEAMYWPKAWALFGPWGVDEVGSEALTESERITPLIAITELRRLAGGLP